jgi:hypothetical protein
MQISLNSAKYTALLKGLHNAIAFDYHYKKGLIYWSDVSMDVIRRATLNGTGAFGMYCTMPVLTGSDKSNEHVTKKMGQHFYKF